MGCLKLTYKPIFEPRTHGSMPSREAKVVQMFISVDPLAEVQPNKTPYHFVSNNPINRIDPTGMLDNPIYDTDGNFLGTDDRGLQGDAIVMNKGNFSQGMAHSEAKAYDLSPNLGFMDESAKSKMNTHFAGLKDRPDYDGFVTIAEGIKWAKEHPNTLPDNITPDNSLYLDASKLNFGDLSVQNIGLSEGQQANVNLFNYVSWTSSSSRATTYALGNTQIKLLNAQEGKVKLFWDDYDWDVHPNGNANRNRLIRGERALKGLNDSHGFRVYIYGTGTIKTE